jgi:hypothetical protein
MKFPGTFRLVEWRARRFTDPVERLQFLRQRPSFATRSLRRVSMSAIVLAVALVTATLVQPFAKRPLGLVRPAIPPMAATAKPHAVASGVGAQSGAVWMVEASAKFDLYSNGLRVENEFVTSNSPGRYLAFPRNRLDSDRGQWRADPAGIVFHTTESHMAPFEENQNQTLMRAGKGIQASESKLRDDAGARGLSTDRYRAALQKKYTDTIQALKTKGVDQENN